MAINGTWSVFEAWLKSKDPETVVGTPSIAGCPVAHWLNETDPQEKQWWVGATVAGWDNEHSHWQPWWMVQFIKRLDMQYMGQKVTAAQALTVLKEVVEVFA